MSQTEISSANQSPTKLSDYPQLLTVDEVCSILRITPPSVRKLIDAGSLRHIRVGKLIRIYQSSVDEIVSEK